ncbi:MAG: HEAT repeat domain-containing protein, partial [Planctomycetota bacterium]
DRLLLALQGQAVADPRVTAAIGDRLALESEEEAVLPLVRAAGRRGSPELAEAIVKAAERKPVSPRVRLAALSALSRLGLDHPASRRYFTTCADAEDWTERSAVLDIAASSGHPGAGPLLIRKLGDPVWQVRLTAVQGLAQLRTRESVEPLISRLEHEEVMRMRRAIGEALFRITGMNFYDSPELWRRWWREKGESFELPPEPPERPPEPAAGRTVGRFYGIPVESDRVIFVIDQSSSMRGFGQRPDELDRAVEETLEVLAGLDDKAFVNVILFENRVHPFRDHLVELKPAARATIKAHLRAQRPRGGTNLYDALEMALLTPDVDTVYLLSDGEPTSGKHVRHPAILKEIKKLNRVRRVTIHCVALGFGSDLLKSLAAQNGGTYVRRF